jgi:hypothetical protein
MCSFRSYTKQRFEKNRTNEFLNRTNKLQATLTKYKTNEWITTISANHMGVIQSVFLIVNNRMFESNK